jgi:soluble lytic murein transglycosylase-like protein
MSARGLLFIIGGGMLAWFSLMSSTGPRTIAKMPGKDGGFMNSISGFFSRVSETFNDSFESAYKARGYAYAKVIHDAELKHGMPRDLLLRMAWAESNFNPNARSGAGALGMFQFMPDTAKGLGFDPLNWKAAADGAGRYMSYLYGRFKSWPLAIAAYNGGEGNLSRFLKTGYWGRRKLTEPPDETQTYVEKITGHDLVALLNDERGGVSV